MSLVKTDLGAVTNYAYAVEHGYFEGTEEEYNLMMTQTAQNAQTCSTSAESASADAETATIKAAEAVAAAATASAAYNTDIVGDNFSTETSYSAGDYVIYDGSLYRFTADHAAGAWKTEDPDAVVVPLANDVADLKSATATIDSLFSALDYNENGNADLPFPGVINGNNVWASLDTSTHRLFVVNPGDAIRIGANSNTGTVYAILSEYAPVKTGATPLFSQENGFTERLTLQKGTSSSFVVPSDGHILYLTYGTSSSVNFPSTLTINGYNALIGIKQELYDLNQTVVNAVCLKNDSVSGDINSYVTGGVWKLPTNITGISNLPYTGTHRAMLIVLPKGGGGLPHQIIFVADTGNYYQRILVDGNWTNWTNIIDSLLPAGYLEDNTDINTILDPGIYFMKRTGGYSNFPFDNSTDRGYLIVIHSSIGATHTLQIAVDGVNGNTYQRIYFDSQFTAWTPTNMNHIIGASPEFKAIDHGGFFDRANHLNYQNSPKAFAEAAHKGIKFHNVDICFTSDGVPVVHHNNTYTDANGVSTTISSTTFADLASHPAGDSSYSWEIMSLADFNAWIKTMGGVIDMLDVSVTDPTNVAKLGAYYAAYNIRPNWTNCNVQSDTTIFINANHDKYGVYLVCDTDADIDTAISYIESHSSYGTKFMLNLHSSGSGMTHADEKIKNIIDCGVSSIYCHLYKASYIETIGIPSWADGVLSETDNIPLALYQKNMA